MSDCSRFESLLPSFVDDELPVEEALRVREHLTGCDACAKVVRSHELVKQRLVGARSPALTRETEDALLARTRGSLVQWGQLAAAALIAFLVPAAIAFTAPRMHKKPTACSCDPVAPELDLGL